MRGLVVITILCWGCVATPLPHPPTLDTDLVTLEDEGEGQVVMEGSEGAASPPGLELRVTWVPGPTTMGIPEFWESVVGSDGSFYMPMSGLRSDYYYVEALITDEDLFLVAVTGGSGVSVVEIDPGDDRDSDESPDEIDCAPDDPTMGGQRCE